jgi:hypothetical protein
MQLPARPAGGHRPFGTHDDAGRLRGGQLLAVAGVARKLSSDGMGALQRRQA